MKRALVVTVVVVILLVVFFFPKKSINGGSGVGSRECSCLGFEVEDKAFKYIDGVWSTTCYGVPYSCEFYPVP